MYFARSLAARGVCFCAVSLGASLRTGRCGAPARGSGTHHSHQSADGRSRRRVQPAQDRAGGVASRVSRVCYRLGPVSRVRMYSSVINTLYGLCDHISYGISYAKRHMYPGLRPPTARVACGAGHAPSTVLRDTHDGAIRKRNNSTKRTLSTARFDTSRLVADARARAIPMVPFHRPVRRQARPCVSWCSAEAREHRASSTRTAEYELEANEPTLLAIVASGRA